MPTEKNKDYMELFELHGLRTSKVSEISEATASSPVPAEERVNFHIGNPVKDPALTDYYLELVAGDNSDTGEEGHYPFFKETVNGCVAYMPRGGFNKNAPNKLVKKFTWWLENQQDPLFYDLGAESGSKECTIASGGITETLRIFFHGLSKYLASEEVYFFYRGIEIPPYLKNFPRLKFRELNGDDENTLNELEKFYGESGNKTPVFLLLGDVPGETARRRLRKTSFDHPLFFVEASNAPNHLSMAREANLLNKVVRFITPIVFSEKLAMSSVVFAAGNSDYLGVIESVHFQLKGTPSAAEVKFLEYYLSGNEKSENKSSEVDAGYIAGAGESEYAGTAAIVNRALEAANKYAKYGSSVERIVNKYSARWEEYAEKNADRISGKLPYSDPFSGRESGELLDSMLENPSDTTFHKHIFESFLNVFVKEHPEYRRENCTVVSGSSRTGLGLLGFICGITELVSCDLSWTYEDCFPNVTTVPLDENLDIDPAAMLEVVRNKISADPEWTKKGAVAINNPHNASGGVFGSEKLKELIAGLADMGVYVIDDLAYQNVMPASTLDGPQTVKQLFKELVAEGRLMSDKEDRIITMHSLSKTDCFAGARMAVAEINDPELLADFREKNGKILPNTMATLIAYLFYRNDSTKVNSFWLARNKVFEKKLNGMLEAASELDDERNIFGIKIIPPEASMYPRMVISGLPGGLSLDWLSSGLASQGIGLVPLSTFARTSKGFEIARKSFRLTLGGTDSPEDVTRKMRRVLIDLNRIVAEEYSRYSLNSFNVRNLGIKKGHELYEASEAWKTFTEKLTENCRSRNTKDYIELSGFSTGKKGKFVKEHLPERLEVFGEIFRKRAEMIYDYAAFVKHGDKNFFEEKLSYEFFKDDTAERKKNFRKRLYDRTVHPTQMYSVTADKYFYSVADSIITKGSYDSSLVNKLTDEMITEFYGVNVAIDSIGESEELLIDLEALNETEDYLNLYSDRRWQSLLSFWGDWDGSSRPSGQGHRLVSAALLENVNRLSGLLKTVLSIDKTVRPDPSLIEEIEKLPARNKYFWELLNEITSLTNQLEKRYKSVLPFSVSSGKMRKIGMKLGIAKDPITILWQHNDRLERRMQGLREQRRESLEYFFSLNKKIRKELHSLIPVISSHKGNRQTVMEFGLYKDLLKRFVLTPRIHQNMITAKDQFAINTTVENIAEINKISGKYGNPGMVLGLQISMSKDADALITLDRKLRAASGQDSITEGAETPGVWSIPLFEDESTVNNLDNYLDKVWDYAVQSRKLEENPAERFREIICELFIAGSDLSQQSGQTASNFLFKKAKYDTFRWLAEKGVLSSVRMKLGSGEPMQRQGGYYAPFSGEAAFRQEKGEIKRLSKYLKDSTVKSTSFARTPLHGVFAGGDFRTFQSNVSEKIRHLDVTKRAEMIYHIRELQSYYSEELKRVSETFYDTRLRYRTRSLNELERLTIGKSDPVMERFIELSESNFRDILYGRDEDVVGIHVISYFISRTMPPLRDRPTVRPGSASANNSQKILGKIAQTIPLSKHGSLLRAIGHNRAQTVVLGVNQLTTGLFRAMGEFCRMTFKQGDGSRLLAERVLPQLPVYEILNTIRLYQDFNLGYVKKMISAFPPGNSAFSRLREDIDSMFTFIPLLKKELLRRHGVSTEEFFYDNNFIPDLLPTLRPDLAVLLQTDLFNADINKLTAGIDNNIDPDWRDEVGRLLSVRNEVEKRRGQIWELLNPAVYDQVKSFVELSMALNSLSTDFMSRQPDIAVPKKYKFETSLTDLLKGKTDDSMRQFLTAAVHYLTSIPENNVEVPVDIIRALKDVERILQLEQQALSKTEQDRLKYYLLQVARLTGENG